LLRELQTTCIFFNNICSQLFPNGNELVFPIWKDIKLDQIPSFVKADIIHDFNLTYFFILGMEQLKVP